jgi:DNA replication protein DnaC
MIEQTRAALKEMRLSTMAAEYARQTEIADTLELTFDERFALLVTAEQTTRADTRLKRLIQAATLSDTTASLEEIRYQPSRNIQKELIGRLSPLAWIRNPRNLIITGATGTGKSWLASAWGMHACHAGYSVKMARVTRLTAELFLARDETAYLKLFDRLASVDVLILDDFGLEPLDGQACRDLLEIVELRYLKRPIIFTAQLPVKEWHGLFTDKTIADAFLDR